FMEVLKDLGEADFEDKKWEAFDPAWEAADPAHRAALTRYWHHAFNEWYAATRLNDALMHQLWDQFYRPAALAGLKHDSLRKALVKMMASDEEQAKLWKEFHEELQTIWKGSHPPKIPGPCTGIVT